MNACTENNDLFLARTLNSQSYFLVDSFSKSCKTVETNEFNKDSH